MIHRAGHVAGHRIDGLDRAGKALRRARIDQQSRRVLRKSRSISAVLTTALRRRAAA